MTTKMTPPPTDSTTANVTVMESVVGGEGLVMGEEELDTVTVDVGVPVEAAVKQLSKFKNKCDVHMAETIHKKCGALKSVMDI